MKKLALCALVLGAGLAASRADVSLGIRIGIGDRHDHHADYRSSHHSHYRTRHPRYVPAPVVHCEPVLVACPVCARGAAHPWARRHEYVAHPEVYAEHRHYAIAPPLCPSRTHGW